MDNFQKTLENLSEIDKAKSLGYLCISAIRALNLMNVTLFDIKPDNLLFSKTNDILHPVFIDFSADFVIDFSKNLTNFNKFLNGFVNSAYWVWPLEIFLLLANPNYNNYSEFIGQVESFLNIKMSNNLQKVTNHAIKKYVLYNLNSGKKSKQIEIFSKMTAFMIGRAFAFNVKDKKLKQIIACMVEQDIRYRCSLVEAVDMLLDSYKLVKEDLVMEMEEQPMNVQKMFDYENKLKN